jgi:hypothetical protein
MPYTSPLFAADPERVRGALNRLEGGMLLPSLLTQLQRALEGSDDAAREYVHSFRVLTCLVLDEAHRMRPDIVIRADEGELAILDVNGAARTTPIEALQTASAEAPFGPWTGHFPLQEAVGLDLTSRVRQLIGLRGLEPSSKDGRPAVAVDDLAARRFLRRVRFHLNDPDGEDPLRRLMVAFGLSKTELGALFGVRRQAIDQWLERGVPAERQEKLQTLLAIVDLLERKLKSSRLPGVSRRNADAYGGKTMLELITANRHAELLAQVRESFDWSSAA